MGQYWMVICMDARQTSKFLGKLGEFLFYDDTGKFLEEQLAVPVYPSPLPPLPVKLMADYDTKDLSPIEKLPDEVLAMVCLRLPTVGDMAEFAMACYRFLEIGRRSIVRVHRATLGTWARKRVICAGDYADDCPPGFLAPEEEKLLAEGYTIFDLGDEFGRAPPVDRQLTRSMKLLLPDPFAYVKEGKAVLCNHTAKEYVRGAGMGDKWPLGNIAMHRILWSSDGSMLYMFSFDIHRGVWAGHRLEITSIDAVDLNESWKDVTKEAADRVRLSTEEYNSTAGTVITFNPRWEAGGMNVLF